VVMADVDAIVAIVRGVAAEQGLEPFASVKPGVLVMYVPPPGKGGRTLRISVFKAPDDTAAVEINVFEWPAFRHTASGLKVLDALRARLRQRFGSTAVSAEDADYAPVSANPRLQRTALRAALNRPVVSWVRQ
jgi:hypothetical protein